MFSWFTNCSCRYFPFPQTCITEKANKAKQNEIFFINNDTIGLNVV